MNDGRQIQPDYHFPIARDVADTSYYFPPAGRNYRISQQGRMRVLFAGREKCLPGYHVSQADFRCSLVELVTEGKGSIRLGSTKREILPGALFYYDMDSPHDIWTQSDCSMTKYFVAFGRENYPAASSALCQLTGAIRWTRDLSAVLSLFDQLIREGQLGGELHIETTIRYLELIMLKFAQALPGDRVQNSTASQQSFERTLACIESHFSEMMTLKDISSRVGVEPNYICRLFREFGSETPNQCLSRHKLSFAAQLLLRENASISQIANQVGYDDPYYFSRIFKKRFGVSPSKFRKAAAGARVGSVQSH